MSGFDNDVVYANNADFSRAGAGGGSATNGLQLDGQLWIGSTAVNAGGTHVSVGKITSTGGSLAITNGPGTINIDVASGTIVTETLTGNSGGAISPSAANINTVGTGSITIAGSPGTHTLTTQLTGLTNHAVLVGAGTATITNVGPTPTAGQVLQSAGAAADPAFSTATYPVTTTINQILYSSSANTITGLATGNNGVLITGTGGIPSILAAGTTGQVLTATTGSPPSWANPASSGTVTSVSVTTANGFAGTVANPTTTPAITLTTTQTGLLSGNGTSITGTPITQFNVITAGATNLPNSVAPTATSGVPLISQGSSSQPIFGTALVAGGGTGDTSFTPYTVICGGTTSTGNLQNVASVGTTGQVLTSNGPGALPTFQAAAAPGAGSWQLIQSQTATLSSSLIFNTSLASFTELMFTWNNLGFTTTAGLNFNASADNGSTVISGINNQGLPATQYSADASGSANVSGYLRIENTPGTIPRIAEGISMPFGGGTIVQAFNIIGTSAKINWINFFPAGGLFSATINVFGR